ncbi:MAG: hypothetical protein UR39_C0012G0012 [Candidatus Woesebacteria bacterium GW2011_GWA1_33_30]|uniref:Big-1 domain-containing protein n=1 Tax=Candidatus Woesebacteria bacterium GW2011_GWA2_33_28 TaxID=1618561 RepID=A0A0G0C4X4_9BACT|nr:MAG: hypothetical protein UR38_C0012G0012 [Candidatus Woesebacteria bacterium GW2011_GWA2_33_28]KKP46931.1 MAG: hypothetical protein UR39_C0012G0012 [Candidatus Woesebacteria bacterium GW2011_GWA1_33_30]KKP48661.1 MAG: hypothetical protein UR40_C0013G0012 [Microgenomates group bacterium GW2011_GWC1_33_32]KKP51350.1 MAG: hypothetical protein UR44_C0012G0012 [Candidatus Woesebacteria bacterium GW2011_GWB1_33_38]KKP57281.1 MAG: hypothetical protein UR48_C0021G0005 [Microgenomates group bacteriu
MRSIFIIFVLILILIVSLVFIKNKTSVVPEAKSPNLASISISNSYVFASPVRARASGDLIRITVFILDNDGFGIADKTVNLIADTKINVENIQSLTDDTGKAIFDISSKNTGAFLIEAVVGNQNLPQKVKVVYD